jgi:hypothetical protein
MSERALKFVPLLRNIADSFLIACIATFARQAVSDATSF